MIVNGEHLTETLEKLEPIQEGAITELSEILKPQLELVIALSGLKEVTQTHDYIDTHHFFWPRSAYTSRLEKKFRGAFLIPLNRGVHNELHSQISPPPMPDRRTMIEYLILADKKEVLGGRNED